MAKYQLLFWKHIPASVKAFDEKGEYSASLPERFQEVIDEIAMRAGEFDSDAYMDNWHWGNIQELPGSANDVARQVVHDLDSKHPQNVDDLLLYFQQQSK